MHGRVHPNYCQITILLVVDPLSSWDYLMMTHPLHAAGNFPIKTLVARQLPTNTCTCMHTHTYVNHIKTYKWSFNGDLNSSTFVNVHVHVKINTLLVGPINNYMYIVVT